MNKRDKRLNALFRKVVGIAKEKDDGGILYGTMREDELELIEKEFRAVIRHRKFERRVAEERQSLV